MVLCPGLFPTSPEENLNTQQRCRNWINIKVRANSSGDVVLDKLESKKLNQPNGEKKTTANKNPHNLNPDNPTFSFVVAFFFIQ